MDEPPLALPLATDLIMDLCFGPHITGRLGHMRPADLSMTVLDESELYIFSVLTFDPRWPIRDRRRTE